MSEQRALFERYPRLRESLPFTPLGDFPTPVHRITELEDALGVAKLWIKRDDISASEYGGNKIRKLEFLLAAALHNKCSHVITFGGFGSNHALATALYCRRLGLKCVAILTPEPATSQVRRQLRYHQLIGTEITIAHDYKDVRATAEKVKNRYGAANCYEIPFGGSSWLGAVGFVNAGLELAQQIAAGKLARPDVIYLGCGTAGSVAGAALGLLIANIDTSIEAVQVTPDSMNPGKLFKDLFIETNRELRARENSIASFGTEQTGVNVRRDQLGEGYAMPTPAGEEAARIMHESTGLPVSLTYTAKTLAALMADAGRGLLTGKNLLFWNTYNSQAYPKLPLDDSWKELPEELHYVFENSAPA
jgi:D-cysteine desulfhydrase